MRGYQSSDQNNLEHSKKNIVCSLFKQPLNNPKIIAGIFLDSGDIIDLFESN